MSSVLLVFNCSLRDGRRAPAADISDAVLKCRTCLINILYRHINVRLLVVCIQVVPDSVLTEFSGDVLGVGNGLDWPKHRAFLTLQLTLIGCDITGLHEELLSSLRSDK